MVSAPERMKIRSRTRAASAVKRARGEKLGGLIPFEQRLARDGVRLEANPGEQSIIATIREDTENVAREMGALADNVSDVDDRLGGLKGAADDFSAGVAA